MQPRTFSLIHCRMRHLLLLLAALALPGCTPTSVTFNFGDDSGIRETQVATDGPNASSTSAKVALIEVRGLIIDGPTPGLISEGRNPVAELVARLRKAEADDDVKAIVLRITSPGGGVGATETMYSEVRRFRERSGKPIVVHLGDVAASGGYYLALAGDYLIASPSGIAGSIGVIIPTLNFSEGMNRWGIVSRSVKSAANKDLANPLEPMREGQYAVLQHMVDGMYSTFKGRVVARRGGSSQVVSDPPCSALAKPIDMARLDELTDGRVMLGREAVDAGLADMTGDLYDAFAKARGLAGLTGARIVKYHRGGEVPTSPYAGAEAPRAQTPQAASAGTEINLLKLNLPGANSVNDASMTTGGAYYLWLSGQ